MENISTKYGILKGAAYVQFYPNGNIREVTLTEPNEIETPYGKLIPQYLDDGFRRKRVKPVIFHQNGNLKNLPLQNSTDIETPAGVLPAELITWYEDGSIRRVFPLDGLLTGFWTEDDEYELSKPLEFNFPSNTIREKVITVQFYKSGTVKSLTFWPRDTVTVLTPLGTADVRIGVSFYPDGRIKSFEPGKPLMVDTPIGKITAYNRTAIGLYGDKTSLSLTETGDIERVVTSTDMITMTGKNGERHTFRPQFQSGMFNPMVKELIPLSIQFYDNWVCFNNNPGEEYKISEYNFTISQVFSENRGGCNSCDGCTACGV